MPFFYCGMLRCDLATWAGLQAVCVISLLAGGHGGSAATSGVVPISDKCWPYGSDATRALLFNRQIMNQKTFYRTSESYWCTNTPSLVGTVVKFEVNLDYYVFDPVALLVRVQWNNGVVGLHRMGVGKKYDLDTENDRSDVLATFNLTQLKTALAPGTIVRPTSYRWPYTDWLDVCNVGLTALSENFGTLLAYPGPGAEFVAVYWTSSLSSSQLTKGFHRYGNGHFDVCFSGCSAFQDFRLGDFAKLFAPCAKVAPSPTMLQALPNSENDIGSRYVIVPPYVVGVDIIHAISLHDFTSYGHPLLPPGVFFVDLTQSSVCIFNYSTCPDFASMHINELPQLMPSGSIISSLVPGLWSGRVLWPPGTVVTDKEVRGTNSSRVDSMGHNGSFDFCLNQASELDTGCPTVPDTTAVTEPTTNASTFGPTSAPAAPASTQCTFDLLVTFYTTFVPLSAACILYLAFRRPGKPFRFNMRPSPVIPVNLLDFRVDRTLVAVAFGATVQIVYLMVTGRLSLHITSDNSFAFKWIGIAIRILMTLVIGFAFYVVFAGMTTPHQPEGVIMGLVFSILFIVFYSLRLVSCPIDDRTVNVLQALPAYISLCILVLYFALRLVRYMLALFNKNDMEALVARYQIGKSTSRELSYLRALLKRKFVCEQNVMKDRVSGSGSRVKNIVLRVLDFVVNFFKYNFPIPTRKDTFSYSPLYLSSISLGLITVYMLIVSLVPAVITALELAHTLATGKLVHVPFVKDLVNVLPASLILSVVLSTCIVILHCLHMLRCYKRHMLRLYRGDDSFLGGNFPAPLNQLKSYGRFLGTQTGYIVYGFLIMFLVLWLIFDLIATFIVLMKYFQLFRDLFYNYVLTTAGTALVVYFAIRGLVQVTMDRKESGKYGVLLHRATYHNMVYFFVFYNIVLGIVSVLLRMIVVAIFNAIMLIRLNRPLMPRGWEKYDSSYTVYCGYLRLEMAQTHPCMLAFVALAKEEITRPLANRQSKAARRWALAYTLVRNPELIPLRAQFVNRPQRKLDASMLTRSLSTGAGPDGMLLLNSAAHVHIDELVESVRCDSVNTTRSDVELITHAC